MPSLQDVEQFKSDLNAVGNEEEILAERGLAIEDVSPPEAGLPDDLSQLLELDTLETRTEEPREEEEVAAMPPEAPEEEAAAAAFDTSDLDVEGLSDVEITDDDFASGEPAETGVEDFDIDGIFPDLEETGLPEPEEPEEPEAEEEFEGISEEEYAGLTGGMDVSSGAEEEPADDFSDVDFELPEDFGEEQTDEETAGEEPPEPGEDQAADAFEEMDFGDIDFEEEAGLGEEMPAAEEATGAPDEYREEEPSEPSGVDAEETAPEEFTFEDEVDQFELPAESEDKAPAAAEEDTAGLEEAGVGKEDFDLDDFSLGDLSEQFGVTEEESKKPPTEEELNPALAVSDKLPGAEDVLDLTDSQFEALKRTLSSLPRNLRIIIEESIGEEQLSGPDLETLVDALVRGRSPREIANIAGRITGQRIVIPAGYEKRTGIEFEEEKGTLSYVFKYKILPFARTVALFIVILGLITFLGYRFLYRPAKAAVLYNRGLEQIEDGSYMSGNEYFQRARELQKSRRRFFQYAEAFIEERRNDLAADKYEELLEASGGFDRQGLLDYARLETYGRAAYAHAEELLDGIIGRDKYLYDYDALLQTGDNYMEWGLENPGKYENARHAYATLIQKYGQRDELMFRMLEYFIRTDNLAEVLTLKDYFQSIDKLELNTEIYAELGGYLVTQDVVTGRSQYVQDARDVLFRTMETQPYLPDVHYHLARLFRHLNNHSEEKIALAKAFDAYRLKQNRNSLDETRFIDTLNRQGEAAFRDREYLQAEDKFLAAKKTFEAAKNRGSLKDNETFGRIYSNLGDVYYYVSGNFPAAMNNYQTAREMGYSPSVLHYKVGYINYRNERYDDALMKFYEAAGSFSTNANLMFATANTLYYQGLYSAAQGYYLHLIADLETMRRNIPDLRPEERPEHRALLENLMRAYTNLGATLYRLSEKSGDTTKVTHALVNLTTASEFFDRLTRDRETLVRTESKNLSFLNTRAIIYPEPGFEVEIYNEIPRDLSESEF
ncbi:MAG: hypothetical protein JW852_08910 [Spirochaetales bacterium]|nr:hypothetical protein [Spirochaetales bacterium]